VMRHPEVEVGSYPRWRDPSYRTKITFDAQDPELVALALEDFVARFTPGAILRVE
jgi:hypothetical protein